MATSIVAIPTPCNSNVHWIQVEGAAYQVVYEATWIDCTITQFILVLYSECSNVVYTLYIILYYISKLIAFIIPYTLLQICWRCLTWIYSHKN